MGSTPEQVIKNAICQYLSLIPDCMFWLSPTTGLWDSQRQIYRRNNSPYSRKGIADILGIIKSRPLAIEVKTKTGKLSTEQKIFLDTFSKFGGIAIVARGIDDVRIAFEKNLSVK